MIKVLVRNLDNVLKFEGDFSTQIEADAWITESIEVERFGKAAYQEISPAVLDEEGNELEPEQVINHPATYTVEIVDITAQLQKQNNIQKNIARMDFGKLLMAELAADNQEAAEAGVLTLQQIIEIEVSLSDVQRLLLNGSLGLAYGLLNQLTIPHLSLDKKQAYLNKMAQYLSNEN